MPILAKRSLPDRPWGNAHDGKRQQRALLAAATSIMDGTTVNRLEAQRLPKLHQVWQDDAWAYRDAVGELRYATTYLGNAIRKVKLVPSMYVDGQLDPIPLSQLDDVPDDVKAIANDTLDRLAAGGPMAMSGMMRDVAENFEVAGECFLVGWPPHSQLPNEDNDTEVWEVRSVSEVTATNDGDLRLRIEGVSGNGEPFPTGSFVKRLWYPHPRRRDLADSPFAAILDIAEELLILSRDIRAAGRSRLANSGILLIPDGLTVVRASTQDDANDEQHDEFMHALITAAITAIQDEGSASAIVPIIVRGPADSLNYVRQVTISRPEFQRAQDRQELIQRMATTLDLPAEVLTGKADLNHWTAWAVSEDTFSDHIEPLQMVIDDAFTIGYYRPAMLAAEVDPIWANKIILWHDATRLVRHPDRSQDATAAFDRFALSEAALRNTMGFSDTDAPGEIELLSRLMMKQSRLDPTIVAQIVKRMDSSIDISAVKAEGPPLPGLSGPGPSAPTGNQGAPQDGQPQQQAPTNPPSTPEAPSPGVTAALTAATRVQQRITRGNKKLSRIEQQLFSRVATAANATMSRALERAGARIRTAVGRTSSGRAWCASHSNIELCFIISNAMMATAGLDEHVLLGDSWNQLQTEWESYLEWADIQTVDTISRMLGMSPDDFETLAESLSEYADSGWSYLQQRLHSVAMDYLSDSENHLTTGEDGEISSTSLVPSRIIRAAISLAGGQNSQEDMLGFNPVSVEIPDGGLTTGPAVSNTLSDNGLEVQGYTWIHGFTDKPFPPHEALDGVEFNNWDDEVLANDTDFPDYAFYSPGDHDGCTCDFAITWGQPEGEVASARPKGRNSMKVNQEQRVDDSARASKRAMTSRTQKLNPHKRELIAASKQVWLDKQRKGLNERVR